MSRRWVQGVAHPRWVDPSETGLWIANFGRRWTRHPLVRSAKVEAARLDPRCPYMVNLEADATIKVRQMDEATLATEQGVVFDPLYDVAWVFWRVAISFWVIRQPRDQTLLRLNEFGRSLR